MIVSVPCPELDYLKPGIVLAKTLAVSALDCTLVGVLAQRVAVDAEQRTRLADGVPAIGVG